MSAKRTGSKTSKSKQAPATAVAATAKKPRSDAKTPPPKQPAPKLGSAKAPKAKAPAASKVKARAAAKRISPPVETTEMFYFFVEGTEPRLSDARPQTKGNVESADNFAAAREKAVDYLIDLIDSLEQRLWQFKQAEDFAAYQSLVNGR